MRDPVGKMDEVIGDNLLKQGRRPCVQKMSAKGD